MQNPGLAELWCIDATIIFSPPLPIVFPVYSPLLPCALVPDLMHTGVTRHKNNKHKKTSGEHEHPLKWMTVCPIYAYKHWSLCISAYLRMPIQCNIMNVKIMSYNHAQVNSSASPHEYRGNQLFTCCTPYLWLLRCEKHVFMPRYVCVNEAYICIRVNAQRHRGLFTSVFMRPYAAVSYIRGKKNGLAFIH